MYNTEFIRYFYILLFFCVVFVAMYNSVTEAIAFKFLTGVQVLFGLIFFFQMLNDSGVNNKGLRIDIPKTMYTSASSMTIPYYLVLLPALIIQLISSVFVTLTTDYLQRRYNHVKLIRNDRWSLEMYKWMFIVSTLSLIFLNIRPASTTQKYLCAWAAPVRVKRQLRKLLKHNAVTILLLLHSMIFVSKATFIPF